MSHQDVHYDSLPAACKRVTEISVYGEALQLQADQLHRDFPHSEEAKSVISRIDNQLALFVHEREQIGSHIIRLLKAQGKHPKTLKLINHVVHYSY